MPYKTVMYLKAVHRRFQTAQVCGIMVGISEWVPGDLGSDPHSAMKIAGQTRASRFLLA